MKKVFWTTILIAGLLLAGAESKNDIAQVLACFSGACLSLAGAIKITAALNEDEQNELR